MRHGLSRFHDAHDRGVDDVLPVVVDFVACFLPFGIGLELGSDRVDLHAEEFRRERIVDGESVRRLDVFRLRLFHEYPLVRFAHRQRQQCALQVLLVDVCFLMHFLEFHRRAKTRMVPITHLKRPGVLRIEQHQYHHLVRRYLQRVLAFFGHRCGRWPRFSVAVIFLGLTEEDGR